MENQKTGWDAFADAVKSIVARQPKPAVCKTCGGNCGQCGGISEPSYIWDNGLGRYVRNKDF